jgi:hypothetical protein
MTHRGRVIDVEVKTNLTGDASREASQMTKDLVRHAANGWNDMLYLYAPQSSGSLALVENAFMTLLETPEVRAACAAVGMDLGKSQMTLAQRIAQGLVDVFDY